MKESKNLRNMTAKNRALSKGYCVRLVFTLEPKYLGQMTAWENCR